MLGGQAQRQRTPAIPLGLLFPLTDEHGSQMAAAAILAIEKLNADRTLLQSSELTFMLNDTGGVNTAEQR